MKENGPRQLDLTRSITEVPQANNIAFFIDLMEALRHDTHSFPLLAEKLHVDKRTVRYYADFARWLQWVTTSSDSEISLTSDGFAFAESVPARGRLFASALFARPLVQTINRLKREKYTDLDEHQATRQATREAIQRFTTLAESTVERRTQALSSMLRWAYRPRDLDWQTGEEIQAPPVPYSFNGKSFLSEFESRNFGLSRPTHIAFPYQVVIFGSGHGADLEPTNWARANYGIGPNNGRWFGSIPVNASTLSVSRRGGPDLRQLLITCNPYIALLVALLTRQPKGFPPLMTLTDDMYGLQLWLQDHSLGAPGEFLKVIAQSLGLSPSSIVPHLQGRHCKDSLRSGTQRELTELLLTTGILTTQGTSLLPSPALRAELDRPQADTPSLRERLRPLQSALRDALRKNPHLFIAP